MAAVPQENYLSVDGSTRRIAFEVLEPRAAAAAPATVTVAHAEELANTVGGGIGEIVGARNGQQHPRNHQPRRSLTFVCMPSLGDTRDECALVPLHSSRNVATRRHGCQAGSVPPPRHSHLEIPIRCHIAQQQLLKCLHNHARAGCRPLPCSAVDGSWAPRGSR